MVIPDQQRALGRIRSGERHRFGAHCRRYLAVHRSLVRYHSERLPDLEVRERLRTLAAERPAGAALH